MNTLIRIALFIPAMALVACAPNPPKDNASYAPVEPEYPVVNSGSGGSLYNTSTAMSLFEDTKARRVGDVLTIVLQESTNASKSQDTDTSRSTSVGVESPTLLGHPVTRNGVEVLNAALTSETEFSGTGSSSQSNSLSGLITVTVVRVLGNGLLEVRGEKWLNLNQGSEYVRVSGLVRPMDIAADNSLPSTKLANARIAYGAKGALAEANRQGWLARFFTNIVWPF